MEAKRQSFMTRNQVYHQSSVLKPGSPHIKAKMEHNKTKQTGHQGKKKKQQKLPLKINPQTKILKHKKSNTNKVSQQT